MDDTKRTKKQLEVMLTHTELAAYSETLAIEVRNVLDLRAEKKNFDKRMGDAIKEKEKEVVEVAAKVAEKKEYREVDCMWEYDWNRNIKVLTRLDTFEVVESRVIPADERQLYLDGIEAERKLSAEDAAGVAADTEHEERADA
jgi:hypothetical protein